jgi:hypothetical protein
MRLFPKDAVGFEKVVYALGFGIPVILILWLELSALGLFHNFYSVACKAAGWGFQVAGTVCFAILVLRLIAGFRDKRIAPSNGELLLWVGLSIGLNCGLGYPYIF